MNLFVVNTRALMKLCPVALIVSALFLSACKKEQPVQAKPESAPVQVRVVPVATRQIQRVVNSVGTLFPLDETVVSAEIEGRVLEVKADLGDYVRKGDVLVRISDEEQKYLVAQTEAQLRMAMERIGLKNENDRIADIRESSEVRRAQADLGANEDQRAGRPRLLAGHGRSGGAD